MGASKVDIYSSSINEIATIAKVFSHPARVAILQYISKQESCICNDIVEEIGLAQATIFQRLNIERFQELQSLFNSFFNQTKSNCC